MVLPYYSHCLFVGLQIAWDTVEDPFTKIAIWRSPTEELDMKLAQTIQLNAIDAALLSVVPPIEALPRSARAPLSCAQQRLWLPSRLSGACEAWQRRRLAREGLERQSEYWLGMGAGAPPTMLKLPTDRSRLAQQDYRGSYVEFALQEPLTARLKVLSWRHGATLFTILLAGWALVLARLSGQDELVIGTLRAKRSRPEIEGLIGCSVHTFAVRIVLSGDPTLETLLGQVNAAVRRAEPYHDLPLEQVVELINSPRTLAHPTIFQFIPAWQNNAAAPAELPGLKTGFSVGERLAQRDLALELAEVGEAIGGRLIYATSLLNPSTIEQFASYLREALSLMAIDVGQRLWSMPLLEENRYGLVAERTPTSAAHPQARMSALPKCLGRRRSGIRRRLRLIARTRA
ncbi:condensation domain-containing protein [Mesorhizobium sp. M0050]|uniref:condensation domain-containing protein n=1 Tax=Mesorhizobium sp. M0050 TaxID=2956861 RepID=UPI00333856F0